MPNELTDERLAEMTEEEVRNAPPANLNIYVGDLLRVLTVKNHDGLIVLEDSAIEIPLMNHMEDSSDEEE